MTTQRLASVISITGGISSKFVSSVKGAQGHLADITQRLKALRVEQKKLRDDIIRTYNTPAAEQFTKEFRKVTREIKETEKELNKVNKQLARTARFKQLAIGLAAAVGTIALAWNRVGSVIDSVVKKYQQLYEEANKAGLETVGVVQRVQFALIQLGISGEAAKRFFGESFKELTLRLTEIQKGTQVSIGEDLLLVGFTTKDINDLLKTTEPLELYSEALEKVAKLTSRGAQAAALDFLFGGEYGERHRTLVADTGLLAEYLENLNTEGVSLGANTEADLLLFQRNMQGAGHTVQLVRDSIVAITAKALLPLIRGVGEIARKTVIWIENNRTIVRVLGTIFLGVLTAASIGVLIFGTVLLVAGIKAGIFGGALSFINVSLGIFHGLTGGLVLAILAIIAVIIVLLLNWRLVWNGILNLIRWVVFQAQILFLRFQNAFDRLLIGFAKGAAFLIDRFQAVIQAWNKTIGRITGKQITINVQDVEALITRLDDRLVKRGLEIDRRQREYDAESERRRRKQEEEDKKDKRLFGEESITRSDLDPTAGGETRRTPLYGGFQVDRNRRLVEEALLNKPLVRNNELLQENNRLLEETQVNKPLVQTNTFENTYNIESDSPEEVAEEIEELNETEIVSKLGDAYQKPDISR